MVLGISLPKFIHSGFKILAVEWLYKNNHSIHKAALEFNISRKVVREWEKKYNELLRMNVGANSKTRWLNSGRTPLSVELDQWVFEFLEEEKNEGWPVTNTSVQTKAVQFADGLGLSTIRASNGWLWQIVTYTWLKMIITDVRRLYLLGFVQSYDVLARLHYPVSIICRIFLRIVNLYYSVFQKSISFSTPCDAGQEQI